MTAGMIVQFPVSVAFGTDEEFDLRVRLERELNAALVAVGAGDCVGSETDTSHTKLYVSNLNDTLSALNVTKEVLTRSGLLSTATVVLETRMKSDPDDPDLQVLWPLNPTNIARSA